MADVTKQEDLDMRGHQQMPKDQPGGSNQIANKSKGKNPAVKTVKRGPGRPKKTFHAIDNLLTVSKAIKKKVKPLKAISKFSFTDILSKPKNERVSGAKRENEESVCFSEKKKPKFDEELNISAGKVWEDMGNIDSRTLFVDTGLQNVVPLEAYSWPDDTKKQVEQENLSMPYLSVSNSLPLSTVTYKDSSAIKNISKEPIDFIPLELNDPSESPEVNSTKSSLSIENVYDVLCWHKEMEDMKPGNVISARMGMFSDLMFQFTLDAGHFLKEATGIKIFVFTEMSPSLTQKSPLAVFVQASNKDLLRIKCQNSDLNLSLPLKGKKDVKKSCTPINNSSQWLKHVEVRTESESVSNIPLDHNSSYCHIRDQRIQEVQKEWAHFVQSVSSQHPELLNEHFQPYVKLTKVRCLNSFHKQNSSGGNGGNSNDRCTYTRHKIKSTKWSKTTKSSDQSARTGHIVKTYECCFNCPKHTVIHGQLTPPLFTCKSSKLNFLDIVYLLETMFLAEIKAAIHKHAQCWVPSNDTDKDLVGSCHASLHGDSNYWRYTDDYIPLSTDDRKNKIFSTTENCGDIFLEENLKRTDSFEGFTKEDAQVIQKKMSKTSRLCSFILPKRSRKKDKYMKFNTQDFNKCTLEKKKGFKIRLWQGFDKRLLQLKADRRKAAAKPFLPSKKVNESHLCQLCQVSFPKLHSLNGHRASMTHCRRVREKMATYCEVLGSITGLEIELKEESEDTLEVVEVIEERVQVEDELGVSIQDDNASTFVTYVYQNPTLSNISKILLENENKEKDRVPLSRFLDSYCGESEDSVIHFGSSERALPEENSLGHLPTKNESAVSLELEGMQLRKRKNSYSLGISRGKKKAKGEWNILPEGPNWLEEVQTSDLGSHELWYFRGQRKKRECQLGPVVHVKKFKKRTKKRNPPKVWDAFWPSLRKCVSEESPRTLGSVDSGISSCQSPYYPHPLLNNPEELYKETGNELNQVESTTKGTFEVQVPHELYEKHRYFRYVDLDRPTEFYYFDVDSEGNPVAVTDLSRVNNDNDKEIGSNTKFNFGENRKDSFLELLESLGEMREENESMCAGVPVFSCTAVPNVSQVSSNTLITPSMTPDRAGDSEENRFIDWTINRSETGFDCDFENLWNCT